jgi:hypothetical protein
MTPELWATLIGALVLVLTNSAAAIKLWGDVQKQKADRAETKSLRDKEALEMRDRLLKAEFSITQLRDSQALTATVLDDLRDSVAALTTAAAKLELTTDNLSEALKELKK